MRGIFFTNGTGADIIGGNSIQLTSGITNNSAVLQTLNLAIQNSGNNSVSANPNNIQIGGAITGTGTLSFIGSGTTTLATNISYSGMTLSNAGNLTASAQFYQSSSGSFSVFNNSGTFNSMLSGQFRMQAGINSMNLLGGTATFYGINEGASAGTNLITVNNGAAMNVSGASLAVGYAGSIGSNVLVVNSGGTYTQSAGSLFINQAMNNAYAAVTNSGNVSCTGNSIAMNSQSGSNNTAWLVQAAGSLLNASNMYIGGGGLAQPWALSNSTALVDVKGGMLSNGGTVYLGYQGNAMTDTLTVEGSGTAIVAGNLSVGSTISLYGNSTSTNSSGTLYSNTSYLTNIGGQTWPVYVTTTFTNTSNSPIAVSTNAYVVTNTGTVNLLSGGKLMVNGSISAGGVVVGTNSAAIQGTNASGINAFVWKGGQLSAFTVNATNPYWNATNSSILNGTLTNVAGTFAPGDLGTPGLCSIQGSYVQSGSATLAIDIGGSSSALLFQHTNAGYYDTVAVSGSAVLGGSLSVSLSQGYVPSPGDTLAILTADGGISGSFTNVAFGQSLSVDGTNAFLVSLFGNSLLLSSYHRMGAPVITVQPQGMSVGIGGVATLSVTAASVIPFGYQWQFNGSNIAGATNASLVLTNLQTNAAGNYSVTVGNAEGSTNSTAAQLSVLNIASIWSQPTSMVLPVGISGVFSVGATTASGAIAYQWRLNGTGIAGATNSSYTVASAQDLSAGSYDVVLTTSGGVQTSAAAQLVVIPSPLLTLTLTNGTTGWGSGATNWSGSPVSNPFSPANGVYVSAVLANAAGIMPIGAEGVTVNTLTYGGDGGILILTGGSLTMAGSNPVMMVGSPGWTGATLSVMGGLSGSGTVSKTGVGTLLLNSQGSFSGNLLVSSGNLTVGSLGQYGSMTVTVQTGGMFYDTGLLGSLVVGGNGYGVAYNTGLGSAGSVNAYASNATFLGSVNIMGPAPGKMAYGAANMPTASVGTNYGYASFGSGVSATNVIVNGRLDLVGARPVSISGITSSGNSQTNFAGGGSGVIVNYNSYAGSNSAGGLGNVLNFSSGGAFAGYLFGKPTYATLTQSGSGTTCFGMFGQISSGFFTNSQVTFAGGNWLLGQLGQNNTGAISAGTFLLNNGAVVTVGGNTGNNSGVGTGYSHGNWIINNGSMIFLGGVASAGGGTNAVTDPLQFTVGASGVLVVTNGGGIQLGQNVSGTNAAGPSSIIVNGGSVAMQGNLTLGNGPGSGVAVNDAINVTVNSGTLSVGGITTVGYNTNTGVVMNEQATFTLNGGKFFCSNAITAPTSLNAGSLITSSFFWNGGQLTASGIVASNANWNGTGSSITSNTLCNNNGVLAPGDIGTAGKTTITGNYAQSGGGVLEIDLAGTNAANGFTNGATNGGSYDLVSVSGSAALGGVLNVRLPGGYTPSASQTFSIIGASGGISGSFSNLFGSSNRVISVDGRSSFSLSTNGTNLVLSGYVPVTPPNLTIAPQGSLTVPGGSATLTVAATGGDPLLGYQWSVNGTNIIGATNATLILPAVGTSNSGIYSVAVANSQSYTTSPGVMVAVGPPPAVSMQSSSGTLLVGGATNLNASIESALPYTCQWSVNGMNINGATNPILSLPAVGASQGGTYQLSVSNASGVVTGLPVVLSVVPLAISGLSGGAFVAGGSATLTAGIQSDYPNGYQWQRNGTNILGATNASLIFSNLTTAHSGNYALVVSNSAGTLSSGGVALVVAAPYTNPTVLFYPFNTPPVTGPAMVPDLTGRTAGTLTGDTNLPMLLTNQPGVPGGCAWDFTQTASAIQIPATAANFLTQLGNTNVSKGLSVSFWINRYYSSTVDINRYFFSIGKEITAAGMIPNELMMAAGIGNTAVTFGNNSNITQVKVETANYGAVATNNTVLDGNWHHVVATLDFTTASNNAIMYRDGVIPPSVSGVGGSVNTHLSQIIQNSFNDTNTADPLWIGSKSKGANPLQGKMAMFGIYSKALTPGEVQVLLTQTNLSRFAPAVSAAADSPLVPWPSAQTGLQGIAVNDGLLPIGYTWSQVSGPGTATFGDSSSPCTTVSFDAQGSYVLRLTATDGTLSDSWDVSVSVAANQAPTVYAGVSTNLMSGGGTVTLTGGASDDGLPAAVPLSYVWSQISGPAAAIISSSSSNNTAAVIPSTPGTYLFQLACSDSLLTGTNSVAVQVVSSLPPVVSAYASSPIINLAVTNVLILTGSATSVLSPLTYSWTQISGNGTATFGAPNASNTSVTLSGPGSYALRLTVSDGTSSSSDDVWVQAWASSPGTLPPVGRAVTSANPPLYVHPRIFFTEADRPKLLASTTDTNNPVVTNAIARLKANVNSWLYDPSTPAGKAYVQMLNGNTNYSIQAIVTQGWQPYGTLCGYTYSDFYQILSAACYLAWVDHDNPANQQLLTNLATVVANAAIQHSTWYLADRERLSKSTDPTAYDPMSYDVYSSLALCYDLMYNWMTEAQRGATRSLLARMTYGRLTYLALEPDVAHSTNWRTFHDHLIIAQLALEGEPGWDPISLMSNLTSFKRFANNWGISPEGINREGTGYFSFGMRNGGPAAYALSRRYEDLFTTTRLYISLQEFVYELKPDASGVIFGMNDGVGWATDNTHVAVLKAAFPNDPMVDWVYQLWSKANPGRSMLASAIFGGLGGPYIPGNTSFKAMAAAKAMPLTLFSPQRGVGETRSDWSTNALTFNFEARPDAMCLGHMHSMINSFSLHALARDWFLGQGYHWSANDIQQTILIDSVAQAATTITDQTNNPAFGTNYINFWPSLPGRAVEVVNQPKLTLFSGDASSAYTYSWGVASSSGNNNTGLSFTDIPNNTNTVPSSINTPWRWRDMFYPGFTPPTPVIGDNTWMDDTIIANNVLYNPVSRAFRTLMMVRGNDPDSATPFPRPYTLVLDDIQKSYSNNIPASLTNSGAGVDTNTHTFTWSGDTVFDPSYSNSIPTNDLVMITNATTTNAILFHSSDSNPVLRPQLLVQVAAANGTAPGPIGMDATPLYHNGELMMLNRLLITRSNTVAPDFKILLYPHFNGEPLPTTTYTNWVTNGLTNGTLTVKVPTDTNGATLTDVFQLQTTPNGRTRVMSFVRGGATPPVISVPAAVSATTASNSAVVNFTVSAIDSSNNPLTVSVTPPSGSSFPVGTTQVSVSASDAGGNTATALFNVTVSSVPPPAPWTNAQIGPITVGSAQGIITYDTNSGTFIVTGRGGALTTNDFCTESLQSWTNNGIFTARIASLSCNDLSGSAFLNARLSTNPGDLSVMMGLTASGSAFFQYRNATNGSSLSTVTNGPTAPRWVRLVRQGVNFSGYLSSDGLNWMQVGQTLISGIPSNAVIQVGIGAAPNTAGYSAYATFDNVSLVGIPASVTSLAASNGVTNVTLNWSPVTGAQGYLVQRSGVSNGIFTNIKPAFLGTSCTDVPPTAGLTFYYMVSATNVAGTGVAAGPVQAGLVPAAPSPTASSNLGQTLLSWNSVSSATSYTLQRSPFSGGPYTSIASGLTNLSYTDTAVTAGNSYFYVLTASNAVGAGPASLEVSASSLTPIQAWRQQWFGTPSNSGIAADTANPSGDGIPNLMKYALGLNPLATNSAARPCAVLSNGCLQISFAMTNDPVLFYGVEVTGDFSAWTNIWSSTGASNSNGPVTVRDTNGPVSSTTRRFLRLRVTTP